MNKQTRADAIEKALPNKAAIRGIVIQKRLAADPDWVASASPKAERRVLRTAEFSGAGTICCYLAVGNEVRTDVILETCAKFGKAVCVPAFCKDTEDYRPAWLRKGMVLKPGPGGVPQPRRPAWLEEVKVDLVVVPGLAFDPMGGRVGHGGGHYDRFLRHPAMREAFKVGLGFEFQMFRRLPMDRQDVRMDAVVTDEKTYRF